MVMKMMISMAGCRGSLGRRALLGQRPSWTQRPDGAANYKWGSRAGTISSSLTSDKKPTYIVIGAGSSGCVLANRLTENPLNEVLLLEAGPRDHSWNWKFHMPAALMYNLCDNKYNWFYHTTAQRKMDNRAVYWPRGRVWGGSSTLNAMVYVRGHPMDYDRWESEGASGWSFSHVLPYFKKAQTHELSQGSSDLYRGWNGPLHVMQGKCENVLHQAFIESGVQYGIGRVDDMNGYKQEGTAPMDLTIHNGLRWSASRAYIWPILDRPNLHTSSGILCTKILFDKNKAIGVEFIRKDGPMYDRVDSWNREKIYCEKGVILSGGAINSPQLLMLSGIGPEKNLKAYDIPVIQHLPGVGRNLQDHLEIYIQQKCIQPITLYDKSSWRFPHNMIKIGLEWYIRKTGLGASSHLESGGFVRSSAEVPHPDIQFHFLPSTVHNDGRSVGSCHAYQVHVGPMRSKSKGLIVLSSKDPRMHPIINPNYLDHEDDFVEFRRAIEISRALLGQRCFDEFRGDELQPGKNCKTDKQLDEFVKKESASAYHPSCTCKMGSETDKYAVVDPKTMGVYGIENLYVADASVMPSIVSGNLNAPAIMVAERAADLIIGKETLKEEFVPIWSSEKCATKEQMITLQRRFKVAFGEFHSLKRTVQTLTSLSDGYQSVVNDVLPTDQHIQAADDALCDPFGRHHKYLRISLTERCNLRCTYCMPAEGVKLSPKGKLLTTDEILRLASIFANLGVKKIRLTGGEPTLRPDLIDIVGNLTQVPGIEKVTITTNGIALRSKLEQLANAGLGGLNISLDTLHPAKYIQITRRNGLSQVLKTIHAASKIFDLVKINNVVIRNFNDCEVINFVMMTKDQNYDVRFIEYMPFQGNKFERGKLVPYKELLKVIDAHLPMIVKVKDDPNSTSKCYQVHGYNGRFGFISSMSEHFCSTCDRLRITADGSLKVCLHGEGEISLRDVIRSGCPDSDIHARINEAISRKKKQHAGFATAKTTQNDVHVDQSVAICAASKRRLHLATRNRSKMTHVSDDGSANMIDVSKKWVTERSAVAEGKLRVNDQVMQTLIRNDQAKGDALRVSRIAGIQGAKMTSTLIPLCHNIHLTLVRVEISLNQQNNEIIIRSLARAESKTGVEMEALTAVSIAALALYDMCKSITHQMQLTDIRLVGKTGGKTTFGQVDL